MTVAVVLATCGLAACGFESGSLSSTSTGTEVGSQAGGRSLVSTPEIRTLPPRLPGPTGGFQRSVALPGRYETTVFRPALRFTLEGSWSTVGESSTRFGLESRTAPEAQCEVHAATGQNVCIDSMFFFGEDVVDGFDLVDVLGDHPEVIQESWDMEVGGHEAVALELAIPYEYRPGVSFRLTGEPLPSSELPDPMSNWQTLYWWTTAFRFMQVEHPALVVQVGSPTPQGLELFTPKAERILDSIQFLGDP